MKEPFITQPFDTRHASNLLEALEPLRKLTPAPAHHVLLSLLPPATLSPQSCPPAAKHLTPSPPALSLRVASFNCRGVYGREVDLTTFIEDEEIGLMALQDLKLHLNAPPQGLPEHTFFKPHHNPGVQGLAWAVSEAWARAASLPPQSDCPHVFWIQLDTSKGPMLAGNVYLPPDHEESAQVRDVLKQIADDIDGFPPGALVILMGDF